MANISIKGAKTHNLKNIDVNIPRNKLTVITGLSGSGKSSLAFDTLYAEGQRRYVESLSAYARQFLSMMEKPEVDHISGLSPAIAIEQNTSHNPRSTVGLSLKYTTIYACYLRVLVHHIAPNITKHYKHKPSVKFATRCSHSTPIPKSWLLHRSYRSVKANTIRYSNDSSNKGLVDLK